MSDIKVGATVKHKDFSYEMKVISKLKNEITVKYENEFKEVIKKTFNSNVLEVISQRKGMNIRKDAINEISNYFN